MFINELSERNPVLYRGKCGRQNCPSYVARGLLLFFGECDLRKAIYFRASRTFFLCFLKEYLVTGAIMYISLHRTSLQTSPIR